MTKKRAFLQNKLWRDLAVDRLENDGSTIHWTKLNDDDYQEQLRLKLIEEAYEVAAADSQDSLCAELADVLEIIDSLCKSCNLSIDDIRALQQQKKVTRGGFEGRRYVTIAEHYEGSFGEKYCLADPEKYPELI